MPGPPWLFLLLLPLAVLLQAGASLAQQRLQRLQRLQPASGPSIDSSSYFLGNLGSGPDARPGSRGHYVGSKAGMVPTAKAALETPCSEAPPAFQAFQAFQDETYRAARAPMRGLPFSPVLPVLPPPLDRAAPFPYASPRSDDLTVEDGTDLLPQPPASRRGYYGHEVGYGGSYFPIGLDPLTILAGLAFLAFIIQTLYLLLYKHYGLGLGVGVGAGAGIGPLSADRHQRRDDRRDDEQHAWANAIASRIDDTATAFGNATEPDGRDANGQSSPSPSPDAAQPAEDLVEGLARRMRTTMGPMGPVGLSPLDALLAVLRRSWDAPATTCGSSWLCRLVQLARVLTEPLGPRRQAPRGRERGGSARRGATQVKSLGKSEKQEQAPDDRITPPATEPT